MTSELDDPEIKETIRSISPNPVIQINRRIKSRYYVVWVIASAFAIFLAFFLGTVAYK